ncbi:MAG TPA: protein kinase [Kofleriaceae bacterium]
MLAPELAELERYEVRRAIGSGGLGVVYEAIDRETGATVAIKTLHDVTPEALYRLKREFRLLQSLEHPNVCQHYELFEHFGRWYIAMECVRGEHILQAVRDEMGDFDNDKLRDALGQLADALCALHAAGLVHRDLKPSNVLVEPSGRVVLLDFGFVERSATGATVQRSQTIVGTPVYMAPEQAVQDDVGPAADWYSFGVILFEALTKQLPHDGDTALSVMLAKQRSDPPRAASIAPDVPADLDLLCAELLRMEPAKRPLGDSVVRRLGHRETMRDSRPVMTSSPSLGGAFVGRSDELTVLRTAYAEAEAGRTVSVVVEGPSGVGKSALVEHFAEEVIAKGALVLPGRCYERESVPYKAFDSVVDALARYLRRLPELEMTALLPRHPDLLVRMFPVLGGVSAMNTTPAARIVAGGDPHEQRNQAFAALREVLHRISQRRPLVITIDDWQWADADSVVLARHLLRHRDSPPMLLVVTARPSDDPMIMSRVGSVAMPGSRWINLKALHQAQAIELVDQLRRSFAPSLVLDLAAIARETQGHPLYISELVRYAATRGAAGEGDKAIHLDEAILARIAALPLEARAIVDVLAVVGEPLPLDIVREAVDFDAGLVQRHAAMLRVAHLVRSANAEGALEPYHDHVRQAVLDSMNDKARLAWHKRIVHAIEASPLARERPELLFRHLDLAGESGRAAEIALAAAQRAVVTGAFDQAAELYAVALRGGHFDARTTSMLSIQMGQALANAGRGHEAARAFLAAAADADPPTRMDCHRQAAEQLLMVGDLERGLEILSELLADVGVQMPTTQKRALASVLWVRARLRLRGLRWIERRETEIAPETLLKLDVLQAASHSLALVDTIRAADFNARWLLFALRIGERSRCAVALATESVYQSSQGQRGQARSRQLNETVRELDAHTPDPKLRGMLRMSEGALEYWVCRLQRAEELFREAERVFREEATGAISELKTTRMFMTFTLRHGGSWAKLRELREEYVEDAERRGDRYVVTSMNRYCSSLWIAADDPDGARRVLADAKWMLPSVSFHTQHWYELDARAEIAMYDHTVERDLPELQPLFDGLERSVLLRLSTVRAMALWLRGRLSLCVGDDKGARQAASRLSKIDDQRARVYSAMLQAGIAGRARDATATAKLRLATELGEQHELRLHAAASRFQLGTLLGGSEGAAHVEAAEQLMLAEGVAKPARFASWFVPGLE